MEYSVNNGANERAASISGKVTFREQGKFQSFIQDLFKETHNAYVIDLADVEHLDSAGLGMLLIARNESIERKSSVTLRKPSEPIHKILMAASFDNVFTIER